MAPVRVRERDTKKNLQMLNAEAVASKRFPKKTKWKKANIVVGDW